MCVYNICTCVHVYVCIYICIHTRTHLCWMHIGLPRHGIELRFLDPAFQDLQEAVESALGEEAMAKAPKAQEKLCSRQALMETLNLEL